MSYAKWLLGASILACYGAALAALTVQLLAEEGVKPLTLAVALLTAPASAVSLYLSAKVVAFVAKIKTAPVEEELERERRTRVGEKG